MLTQLRHLVFGSPLPSADLGETRLDKVRALAALSPDALASVAYANQEIYLGLLVAGAAGLGHAFRLALVISCLLYTSPSPRDRTRSRMPSSACKKTTTTL